MSEINLFSEMEKENDQLNKLENLSAYDLNDVTAENETAGAHFIEPETIEPKPKKGRGRPLKPVPPQNNKVFGAPNAENDKTFIEQEAAQEYILEDQEQAAGLDGNLNLSHILPTDTFLVVVDKLMSVVIPFGLNKFAGGNFTPADFKLSADEKKTMKPPLEAALKTIKINLNNPWLMLSITAVAVYGAKVVDRVNFDNVGAGDIGGKTERRGRPRKS